MLSGSNGHLFLGSERTHQHVRMPCSKVKPAANGSCVDIFPGPQWRKGQKGQKGLP